VEEQGEFLLVLLARWTWLTDLHRADKAPALGVFKPLHDHLTPYLRC